MFYTKKSVILKYTWNVFEIFNGLTTKDVCLISVFVVILRTSVVSLPPEVWKSSVRPWPCVDGNMACDVCEFTQKLCLDSNYYFSFRVVILIAFYSNLRVYCFFLSMGCLSVYKYIRTSNPLPTVSSRSVNSCSNSGCQRLLLGERVTRLAGRDARGCSKANSNNRMPSKLFLWTFCHLGHENQQWKFS